MGRQDLLSRREIYCVSSAFKDLRDLRDLKVRKDLKVLKALKAPTPRHRHQKNRKICLEVFSLLYTFADNSPLRPE